MAVIATTQTYGGVYMDGNRRWFGWVAIGLAALALLVALGGRGFGPQIAAGYGGPNIQQPYAQPSAGQQSAGPQSGSGAPGANVQPGVGQQSVGPQSGRGVPGANQQGARPQRGGAPGANEQRGLGRPRDGGFGLGGWLRFPLKLLGGSFQMVMLALLIVFGVWWLRGRTTGGAAASQRAQPAQGPAPEPQSPTGESYTDEPTDRE
jgi:hypothetical protein